MTITTHHRRAFVRLPAAAVLLGLLALAVVLGFVAGGSTLAQAATFTVDSTGDGGDSNTADGVCDDGTGACTLRAAIEQANASAGADTINFNVTGTITLALGELTINQNLNVNGPGAANLTISGNNASRVFKINSGTVTISDVTIQNGTAPLSGGGIRNQGTLTVNNSTVTANTAPVGEGGGIRNQGTLTVNNSTVSGNTALFNGGGIHNSFGATATLTSSTVSGNMTTFTSGSGGGILNLSALTINSSTVSGNEATAGNGGGILNTGPLTINSSTVSGNLASLGGGILNIGPLTVTNSTLSGNTASTNGGGIFNLGPLTLTNSTVSGNLASLGGGIHGLAAALKNTIVANNFPDDCSFSMTSLDYNLDSDDTCGLTGANDIPNGSANLGLLALNAPGNTETHALLLPSAAIDKIPVVDCTDTLGNPITADQRGFPRPQDGDNNGSLLCDIGAFERHAGEHDVEARRIGGAGAPTLNLFQGCNSNPCTVTRTHALVVRNNSDHTDDIGVDYKVVGWPAACTVTSTQFGTQSGGASITVNNTVATVHAGASAAIAVALIFSCPASAAVDVIGTPFDLILEAAHPTRPDDVPSNDIVTRVQIIN